jgi:hypothetical protein
MKAKKSGKIRVKYPAEGEKFDSGIERGVIGRILFF